MQWPSVKREGHIWSAMEAICAALAIVGPLVALWITNTLFESGTVNATYDQFCFLVSRLLIDLCRLGLLLLLWFSAWNLKLNRLGWCVVTGLSVLSIWSWKPLDRVSYYYSGQLKIDYVNTYKARIGRAVGQGRITEALRITKRAEDALQGTGLFDGELSIAKAKFETSSNLSAYWLKKYSHQSLAAWTPERGPKVILEVLEAVRVNPHNETATVYLRALSGKVATAISRIEGGEKSIDTVVRPQDRKLFDVTVKRADLVRNLKAYWYVAETECQLAIAEIVRSGTGEIPLNIAIARLPLCRGLRTGPVQSTSPVPLPPMVNPTPADY